MKIAGMFLVVGAMCFVGVTKYCDCKKCCYELKQMISILELLEGEISTRRSPVNTIIERMKNCFDGAAQSFASQLSELMPMLGETDFCSMWKESAYNAFSSVPQDCLSEFVAVGASLGKYTVNIQCEAIGRCTEQLRRRYTELQPELADKRKLYLALYGGAGLIMAIALI